MSSISRGLNAHEIIIEQYGHKFVSIIGEFLSLNKISPEKSPVFEYSTFDLAF